jgi:hypothetical protein
VERFAGDAGIWRRKGRECCVWHFVKTERMLAKIGHFRMFFDEWRAGMAPAA